MAEAAAVIGLVASIASLVDLSAKVVSRLREYSSKTVDVPESFSSLLSRLPLLAATLQRIQSQAEANHLPRDVTKALQAVIDTTTRQISIVHSYLRKVLPSHNASKFERAFKALRSLSRNEKVEQAVEKIHKNVDFLVLHQTTRHVDMGDRILDELSKMTEALPTPSVASATLTAFGKCLGNAPTISPDAFIGRELELRQLRDWLSPKSPVTRHNIVSIVGMGGMGKTQLSLAHVQRCGSEYTSVFWLNAKDEASLKQSVVELSRVIFPASGLKTTVNADAEKQTIEKFRQWLSMAGNDRWLLILDNYDDLDLPGARSSTGYDIRPFLPPRSQGSIIITSRSTRLSFTKQLKLQKIEGDNTSIAILSQRCGRDVSAGEYLAQRPIQSGIHADLLLDESAIELVQRLGGLPLALATAGGYLRSIDVSCAEYLALYRSTWTDLTTPDNAELLEYEARTLSSTWTVSLNQITRQDEDAAQLLLFFAYLGDSDIWYELVRGGADEDTPWLRRVTTTKIHFQRTMSKLLDYSLVDIVAGSYQVHPCLHDWLVETSCNPPESQLFIAALHSVSNSIESGLDAQHDVSSRRLFEHVEQLESNRFDAMWDQHLPDPRVSSAALRIGMFEVAWYLYERAEHMFQRALIGREKTFGSQHELTLDVVTNLGIVYRKQDKLKQAEETFGRVLKATETLTPDHVLFLDTVHHLAMLYQLQDKPALAEDMYRRALTGREKVLGTEHVSTLATVDGLGVVYEDQGKLDQAEEMYLRALSGYDRTLGPKHATTLHTVNNLGIVYQVQGRCDESERMLMRALIGREETFGPDHVSVADTLHNLGIVYQNQDRLDLAEETHWRALTVTERILGPDHTATLHTVHSLAIVHQHQRRLDEAEIMYQRALIGMERAYGSEHRTTLQCVFNFGTLYQAQGRLDEAERMFSRTSGLL